MSHVVIATHTVMDGLVLRWYASEVSATHGKESISASRNGVMGGSGAKLTPELFEQAWDSHKKLERRVTVEGFADIITHKWSGFGDVVKIEPVSGNPEGVQS